MKSLRGEILLRKVKGGFDFIQACLDFITVGDFTFLHFILLSQVVNIKRRCLIDKVIKPV